MFAKQHIQIKNINDLIVALQELRRFMLYYIIGCYKDIFFKGIQKS